MKTVSVSIAAATLAALSSLAFAGGHDHAAMQGQVLAAKGAQAAKAEGEVRKIDAKAGKITLKHGPIANLDMPPMTMVFGVSDRALLQKVKVGDKVHFAAENKDGALTVTALEPAGK